MKNHSDNSNGINKMFHHCKFCKKRLIERMPNGLFRFMFGAVKEDLENGIEEQPAPVDLMIHGSVKIMCLRKTCRKYNIFTFLNYGNENKPVNAGDSDEKKKVV